MTAERRMISKLVFDDESFINLSDSAKALYCYLNLDADSLGFVGNPKKTARAYGYTVETIQELISSGYLLSFDSGVVVVREWHAMNTIKNDRNNETNHKKELAMLSLGDNSRYVFGDSGIRLESIWKQLETFGIQAEKKSESEKESERNTEIEETRMKEKGASSSDQRGKGARGETNTEHSDSDYDEEDELYKWFKNTFPQQDKSIGEKESRESIHTLFKQGITSSQMRRACFATDNAMKENPTTTIENFWGYVTECAR